MNAKFAKTFKELRIGLRKHLKDMGYTVSDYFEEIGGVPVNLKFHEVDGGSVKITYGINSEFSWMRPRAWDLARALDTYVNLQTGRVKVAEAENVGEQIKQTFKKKKTQLKEVTLVSITEEEYQEYQTLKAQARQGKWFPKSVAEKLQGAAIISADKRDEFKYGYVSPEGRARIDKQFRILLARMNID
jgi:hypothetical protein